MTREPLAEHLRIRTSGPRGAPCITCADEAVEVTVVAIADGDLARVDTGEGMEEVSVMLVDAVVGDRILVHAGEAIGVVRA